VAVLAVLAAGVGPSKQQGRRGEGLKCAWASIWPIRTA
jgi:hypothetical protein